MLSHTLRLSDGPGRVQYVQSSDYLATDSPRGGSAQVLTVVQQVEGFGEGGGQAYIRLLQ